ncbi:hypothetical protein BS47DRAFT_1484794 [Hydnum rufescens UP504]|uniref:Uncharacterized protein n=1 Tax=Hydnum rufescens UP504 TaxID=1448309 RepID=A0A9P6B0V6_9AGAM|nr:hypothetical protein BS47DRAFT_1484794 [Hydnum rufescens UP504]
MDSHWNYNFPDGLSIQAFASPSAARDDNETLAQNIEDYGIAGRIWEAAYDLQQYFRPPDYLEMDPPCSFCSVTSGERKTVIELGSGTGVGGLSAARVLQPEDLLVLTDLAAVLPLLEINLRRDMARRAEAEKSAGEVWIRALPWGDTHVAEAVRLELRECGRNVTQILCSDLVYFPALLAPLLRSLIEITSWSAGVEVIISCRLRDPIKETPFWSAFGVWFEFTPVLAKDLRKGPGSRWTEAGLAIA